ncbi:hypothetical protein [Fusobacterium mortiferum]|uniref:hypothetical protein n=1 Tax=Fusobacterium mortiferum TaxID=850 RepID=UPI00158C301D|nr:hypothetical protein [Fusobacterium mortiferum]MCF2699157.1 hypothetical protein [Fusobacterium mortiferum]MCI7664689.1 hypothetical protein [Fusobacterium mortiferum]
MIRNLKYKKDMELLNAMVLYNNLLKEAFESKSKTNLKLDVPSFKTEELTMISELKIVLNCLKHNYKQLIRYLNDEEYSPLMKVIYLSTPDCYPIHLKVSLKEYFNFDLYINKEELFKNNTSILTNK